MIQIANRQDIFSQCPALAKYMQDWQQAEYDDMLADADEDELAFFQGQMDIITHNYTHTLQGETIYKPEADNIYDYLQALSDAIFKLAELMGWNTISFMVLYKTPWLLQKNPYPPVATELKYLQSIGIDTDSADAISATGVELKRIIKTIFWLGRCNALLPYIHFSATGADWVLYICKYGYLHVYTYNNHQRIHESLLEAGFSQYTGKQEDFLEGGAMIGRV